MYRNYGFCLGEMERFGLYSLRAVKSCGFRARYALLVPMAQGSRSKLRAARLCKHRLACACLSAPPLAVRVTAQEGANLSISAKKKNTVHPMGTPYFCEEAIKKIFLPFLFGFELLQWLFRRIQLQCNSRELEHLTPPFQ